MYDIEGNERHSVPVIICPIVDNLINTSTLREKKQVLQCTNSKMFLWKESPTYWKFKDKIFKFF